MKDTDLEFTPETLRALAREVEDLRHRYLFDFEDLRQRYLFDVEDAGADPMAEQHYLLALGALDQAVRYFTLAGLAQSAGIVGR